MPRKIGLMAFRDITSVQAAKRSEGSSDLRTQARCSAAEGGIAMSASLSSKRMSSDYGHLTKVPIMFPDNTIEDCCGEGTVPLATMKALRV